MSRSRSPGRKSSSSSSSPARPSRSRSKPDSFAASVHSTPTAKAPKKKAGQRRGGSSSPRNSPKPAQTSTMTTTTTTRKPSSPSPVLLRFRAPSLLKALLPPPPLAFSALVLVGELFLCLLIIRKVAYTEIDWEAYMSEVSGYLSGERDYEKLRGGTGPLVYPAGFLYVFSWLRWFCGGDGSDIGKAQLVFAGLYVANRATVMATYYLALGAGEGRAQKWRYAVSIVALSLSQRVHSIYVLRCFNDCVAAFLCNLAVLVFVGGSKLGWLRNHTASVPYSLSVSAKMNTLLFAPGILLIFLQSSTYGETFISLSICAGIQLVLGYPFLSTYPVSYLKKAFELSRVFFFKWTVNLKFLPEDIFVSKPLSLALLGLHVAALGFFCSRLVRHVGAVGGWAVGADAKRRRLSPHYIATVVYLSNFVGIVFARTLHYQFYSWYFDSLPLLIWTAFDGGQISSRVAKELSGELHFGTIVAREMISTASGNNLGFHYLVNYEDGDSEHIKEGELRSMIARAKDEEEADSGLIKSVAWIILIMGGTEYAFNVFPATPKSSLVLQVCHFTLLAKLWWGQGVQPLLVVEGEGGKGAEG
eukprot:CAMPEP_0182473054 /NCGR_PEP_ID=MMETSP1319-20130603/23251_1 /TAXON_ID=172717 /ORGANISM="Bolidomonas pacifica, Strain RCC208" /LENGTH=586 /DNA_ID=CAMNT_0024673811 /DNA_START=1 /DNA_END=1757 /DNA_ORIENTATION=+